MVCDKLTEVSMLLKLLVWLVTLGVKKSHKWLFCIDVNVTTHLQTTPLTQHWYT